MPFRGGCPATRVGGNESAADCIGLPAVSPSGLNPSTASIFARDRLKAEC